MNRFRPDIFHMAQSAGLEPFFGGSIGGLGVHIDEPVALLDGDEIIFGFSVGIVGYLAPNLGAGGQQFPATAGVLYMANFHFSVDLHMGNKPVGPGDKGARNHSAITHNIPPFFPLGYHIPKILQVAEKGVDSMSGARQLRRVIAKSVEDLLSDYLLDGSHAGERIVLELQEDQIRIASEQEELMTV